MDEVDDTGAAPGGLAPQAPNASHLIATAQAVTDEVKALREDLASRRSLRRAWKLVAFDIALSLVSLALWYSQVQTNHRLQESLHQNYVTAQQQASTRVRVLCPLYEVLLAAAADPSRRAQLPPSQWPRFDAAVRTIRAGYAALGCQPPLPSPAATPAR